MEYCYVTFSWEDMNKHLFTTDSIPLTDKVPLYQNPALKTKEFICAYLQSMGELVIKIWVSLRQMTASWLWQSPLFVNLPLSIHTSISQDHLQVGTYRKE